MRLVATRYGTAQDMLRLAMRAKPSYFDGLRRTLLGPAKRVPRCPLRQSVVGPYRPDDQGIVTVFTLVTLLLTGLGLLAIKHHMTWMYYVELIISICT